MCVYIQFKRRKGLTFWNGLYVRTTKHSQTHVRKYLKRTLHCINKFKESVNVHFGKNNRGKFLPIYTKFVNKLVNLFFVLFIRYDSWILGNNRVCKHRCVGKRRTHASKVYPISLLRGIHLKQARNPLSKSPKDSTWFRRYYSKMNPRPWGKYLDLKILGYAFCKFQYGLKFELKSNVLL